MLGSIIILIRPHNLFRISTGLGFVGLGLRTTKSQGTGFAVTAATLV